MINFLVFLIYYVLIVIIAVVAKDNLHATASQAGLAVGIYIIGTVVARLLAGRFISVLGCRKMLYLGLFIYLASTAMYFYTPNSVSYTHLVDTNEISRLRMEGLSIAAIARQLECSPSVIRNRLKQQQS